MKAFDRDKTSSDEFVSWILNHPDGFVVNMRSSGLMLHRASCGHFKFKETDDIIFFPKRVFLDRDELQTWAKEQSNKRYSLCRSCGP